MLGVIALITTGPNALKKINDPAAEVKSLLKYIENMEENVRVKLVEYLGSLKNTHSQSIPTPAELEKIIDLLSKVDVEVGFNFKLNSVLSQLERYGDKIYLILDNIKQRKIMEAQSNNQITQLPLMPLLDIIARPPFQEKLIGNEYNQIQGIFESNPEGIEDMQRFVAMLSLLSDDLKDREALSNEILGLAGLARLPRDQRDLFFSIMGDVDISRSTSLPSLENIREILIAIKESPQEYNNREAILKLVQDVLPDTKIGKEPINESLVGLVGVFQDFFKDMNFNELIEKAITEDIVPNLPKLLQKSAAEILRNDTVAFRTAVNQFKDSLAIEPVDLGVALQKLKNLDDETAKLLDYKFAKIKVLPFVRGKILNLAGEEHQDKLGAFFERKTLMVLLKENLEARFKKNLNSSIKVLQTANEPFNKFLTDALGGIDDRKPIDNALKEYSDRFDIVNGFANGLIRIRNRNEADYRRVLALINSPANLPHFQIPKMLQMTQIMSYLLEQPNVSIESQLNIILNALETHKPSIETIQKSLEQVKLLVKSSESLGVEAYKALLKASLNHNLTKPELFPLRQMIALKSIPNIDEEQSEELFNRLVSVIERIPPQVGDEVISQFISTTTKAIESKVVSTPTIVPLTTLLLKKCTHCNELELQTYIGLLDSLPEDPQSQAKWIKIITRSTTATDITLEQIKSLQAGLVKHDVSLDQIANLFSYQPYPKLDKLLTALEDNKQALDQFITNFDKDPKSGRAPTEDPKTGKVKTTEEIIHDQFETNRIQSVITGIKGILENKNLSPQQQYDLTQQIVYINAIGKDFQLEINGKTYPKLIEASREQLRELSDELIKQLRTPGHTPEAERAINLKLMAVMREMHFRSTGKFPRTTQMITLLLSLDNPDNLLMEINTGEGKSITTALLAALQWAKAKGDTVNVCTANMGLVDQDYTQKGAVNFFDSMGIPSAIVRSDSPAGTYKVGGINYSNVANLSLYRSRAKLEGESLTATVDGREIATHLILDESDYVTLEDKTLFNLAMGVEGSGGTEDNPFSWVYPLINEFIDQEKFQNLNPDKGDVWTRLRDIKELKTFLDERAGTVENKKLLASLEDKKFDNWLTAACVAKRRIPGTHYIIQEEKRNINGEEKKVYTVVPLINTVPQIGAIFSNSEQQFLQARLQKEDTKGRLFPIDPEMLFVASESAKDFIDAHRERGRIIGISGTVGVPHELMEQQVKYGLKAISIPPHEKNLREELKTRVTKSKTAQVDEIKKHYNSLIKTNSEQTQPVLMICKDINQARDLYNKLGSPAGQIEGKELQIITGEESEEERQRMIEKAGQPNVFTISTSLLGRGTDIDPKHDDGLFVIQAYLDTERNTRQIIGRAARNGKVGQYVAIYDENDIPHRQQFGSLMKMSSAERAKTLKKIQKIMNQEAAVERHFIQEVAMIQQVAMKQFDEWQGFLNHLHSEPERKELKKSLLLMREGLITELTEQWRLRLEESDPKKAYPNPYIRRDPKGKLITQDLNAALKSFEVDAARIWAETRVKLSGKTENKLNVPVEQLRAEYMLKIDFSEQLKLSKLNAREERKAAAKEQELALRRIESGLDPDAAVLRFGGTDGVPLEMQQRSAWTQLKLIANNFNDVTERTSLKDTISLPLLEGEKAESNERLEETFTQFAKAFQDLKAQGSLSEQNRMQPVVVEFLAVYNQVKGLFSHEVDHEVNGPGEDVEEQSLPRIMNQLQTDYIDTVANQLAKDLEQTFSWAKEKGFFYFIERTAVKKAVAEILNVTKELEEAKEPAEKQDKIKELYRLLQKHQAKLEDLWIPSFGHKNTRDLIKNTIRTFDDLARVADLPPTFRAECREEALFDVHYEKYSSLIAETDKKIQQKYPEKDQTDAAKKARAEWRAIKAEIEDIHTNNKSLYAFSEIDQCLARHKRILQHNGSSLLKFLQELIYKLLSKSEEVSEQYPELMDNSRYLSKKAEQVQTTLNGLQDVDSVKHVSIKHGHTGFSEYFDLVIEGAGKEEVFTGFTRYNTQLDSLVAQHQSKRDEMHILREKHAGLHTYIETKISRPITGEQRVLPIGEGLPEQFNETVTKINTHINLLNSDGVLNDNESFRAEVRGHISNRTLVSGLTAQNYPGALQNCTDETTKRVFEEYFKNFSDNTKLVQKLEKTKTTLLTQLEEAEKAKDKKEKGGFINFLSTLVSDDPEKVKLKIEENAKALNAARGKVNLDLLKETEIDRLDKLARSTFKEQLTGELTSLHEQLGEHRGEIAQAIEVLNPQIDYLDKMILEEKGKSSVMMRRFEDFDELLAYEATLKAMPKKVIQEEVRLNVEHEGALEDEVHPVGGLVQSQTF